MKKYIYKITNKINNKIYIGQTVNYKRRFAEHKRQRSGNEPEKILYQAFSKYGIENFNFELIEECENYNEREIFWIKYYNSLVPNGYNMTEGGENPPVFHGEDHYMATHTWKDIDNIIQLLQNSNLSIEEIAEKTKYNASSINRINKGELWFKENLTYPLRAKITKSFLHEQALNIINDLKNTTLTQKEIAKKYNVSRTTVTAINNGQNHKQNNLSYPIRKKNQIEDSKKPVYQYDLNNNFIQEFESAAAAGRALGKERGGSHISACATGKAKTAYGYIWKYK